ncbi:phosphate/phosphite/phosphonate ABC transporter substrate-binding protein [Nonomuraea monospora]|uniref:Phosphate/phosphite/phosphonate ABC transporter substrate-binding protein n=1 Tax=Nonomuraea monospora TaxID=568818 RepID=A0ABN3C648_9ACTN
MKPTLTALAMIGALAAAGCSSASGSSADGGDVLRFAAIPTEQNIDPTAEYKDLIALLEKNTGRKVEFVRSTDYNAVIEGMVSGKIDLAEFGPLSYVLARSNGAKVCFVDPGSTSGYLFPSQGLLDAGIDPKTGVRPVMAGGHDNSVLSVASGKCQAGFSESGMVDHILIDKGKLKQGDAKVVWKSRPIPMSPVALRDELPADLKTKLQQTFTKDASKDRMVQLGICADTESCAVTNDKSIWSWQAVTDATFDPVREVCAATENEKCSKA